MTISLRTLIKTHHINKDMPLSDRQMIFDKAMEAVSSETSLRQLLTVAVLFHASSPLSGRQLDFLRHQVEKTAPSSLRSSAPLPTGEKFVLLPLGKDMTLAQLGQTLTQDQMKRFLDENFGSDPLDYLVDQLKNPVKHAKGFYQKALIGMTLGLAKKVNETSFQVSLLEQMQFSWTDDGATNKEYTSFLANRDLSQNNTTTIMKM